jgi:hypothetical protein
MNNNKNNNNNFEDNDKDEDEDEENYTGSFTSFLGEPKDDEIIYNY